MEHGPSFRVNSEKTRLSLKTMVWADPNESVIGERKRSKEAWSSHEKVQQPLNHGIGGECVYLIA